MEILYKGTVSAEFRANCPKLYGNCVVLQDLCTRKLDENTAFYAVLPTSFIPGTKARKFHKQVLMLFVFSYFTRLQKQETDSSYLL